LTEKPVELAVAEQTGRTAFLMEIDPAYCDVIVERFERFAGTKAKK
jgi:DNA modification methylase